MAIGHATIAPPRAEVVAGTAFDVLVALAAASAGREPAPPELQATLDDVGDTTGESWLNLFGLPLDLGPPYDAGRLASEVASVDPLELRRHVLGRHAWSWCTLAGTDTIEAAAAGDSAAADTLLAHDRYYAGRARASLSKLVRLDPERTRAVVATALEVGAKVLGTDADRLEAAASAGAAELEQAPLVEAIETITGGYRYVPEVEADRVLLVPHTQPGPWLVLVQHRGARIIVYGQGADRSLEERVAALGRALADPKRVEIVKLLGRGTDRVSRLVAETGLSRSTVHHHLTQLREARLVELEGNARAYRYRLRPAALGDSTELLSVLLEERAG